MVNSPAKHKKCFLQFSNSGLTSNDDPLSPPPPPPPQLQSQPLQVLLLSNLKTFPGKYFFYLFNTIYKSQQTDIQYFMDTETIIFYLTLALFTVTSLAIHVGCQVFEVGMI